MMRARDCMSFAVGTIAGVAMCAVAIPFLEPKLCRTVKRGKRLMTRKMREMHAKM